MQLMRQTIAVGLIMSTLLLNSCRGRSYKAGSSSMEGTIAQGETIFISPATEFQRNDIAVFSIYSQNLAAPIGESGNYKMHWETRVYRVIALSGDSLSIKEGEVFVNNKHLPLPELGKISYEVISTSPIAELNEQDPYKTSYLNKTGSGYVCQVALTNKQADSYREQTSLIKSITRFRFTYNVADTFLAKPGPNYQWSVDDYGPLRIPAPGETIEVTDENYKMYQHIPEIRLGKNLIKEKLYFLMGDNRHSAADSRFSGFISHSKMSGVVK